MLVSTSLSTLMLIHAFALINGIASGVEEVKKLFTGLFAALENDTTPSTLGVDHLKVEQDGVFSQVFLVWKCPGAGFEKVHASSTLSLPEGLHKLKEYVGNR